MNRNNVFCFLLASVPFLAICFAVPLWDHVHPLMFGLPFNMFWLIAWMPLTSLCLWGVYRLRNLSGHSIPSPKRHNRR
jgi:hypothetical protein